MLPVIPSRLQLCNQELAEANLSDDAHFQELRRCLASRYAHERDITKECKRLMRKLQPQPRNGDERFKARHQCLIDHQVASYLDLAPAPIPAARPAASSQRQRAQAATTKLLPTAPPSTASE